MCQLVRERNIGKWKRRTMEIAKVSFQVFCFTSKLEYSVTNELPPLSWKFDPPIVREKKKKEKNQLTEHSVFSVDSCTRFVGRVCGIIEIEDRKYSVDLLSVISGAELFVYTWKSYKGVNYRQKVNTIIRDSRSILYIWVWDIWKFFSLLTNDRRAYYWVHLNNSLCVKLSSLVQVEIKLSRF